MKKFFAFLLGIFLIVPTFADNAVTGSGTECVYSTLNTYTGPSTIKANWDPNTINLYWYNDDQKLTVQTAANTCNYDSGIALPSTNPTKTGYTFSGWEVLGGVPAGYTMVEYIRATGTQKINTGIYANENTVVKTKFINRANSSESTTRIIIADAWSNSTYQLSIVAQTTSYARIGTLSIARSNYWQIGTEYVVEMGKNIGQVVNGVKTAWSGSANTFTSTNQLSIFGTSDASNRYAYADLYYLEIWQNGSLARNFIPVKRDNDNVVGMWDTVSQTFFTNVGSGTFTAGPAIQ